MRTKFSPRLKAANAGGFLEAIAALTQQIL